MPFRKLIDAACAAERPTRHPTLEFNGVAEEPSYRADIDHPHTSASGPIRPNVCDVKVIVEMCFGCSPHYKTRML
jgi:hypothetical protein